MLRRGENRDSQLKRRVNNPKRILASCTPATCAPGPFGMRPGFGTDNALDLMARRVIVWKELMREAESRLSSMEVRILA